MPVIPIAEAIERVAAAVETATADDVREVYGELYPRLPLPPAAPSRPTSPATSAPQSTRRTWWTSGT
jgi:hypothetical protein